MDWTEKKRREAEKVLRSWAKLARGVPASNPSDAVKAALRDDLNTHLAISELHRLYSDGDGGALRASAQLLGLMSDVNEAWLGDAEFENLKLEIVELVGPFLDRIDNARHQNNYDEADRLRDGLREAGVFIRVTKEGAKWNYTLQDAARMRDKDLPEHGFLGASVHIAEWMQSKLEALK